MPSVSRVGISDTDTPRTTESSKLLLALVARLHFYAGVLVGPFILVAALSGLLYALTPQLENWLYSKHLYTESQGAVAPLSAQIEAAQAHLGESGLRLAAVRPAPGAGQTTRVMFAAEGLDASEHKAVFIDPVTAEPRGDLIVYGTTGVLPLRNWIGDMHRRLFLGDWGRLYSEMAASWLWLIALGGLTIWLVRERSRSVQAGAATGLKQWHGLLGVILLLALLFFSATGLTWSKWAGANISVVRAAFGMSTPGLSTQLAEQGGATGAHHNHQQRESTDAGAIIEYALIDDILLAARASGIDANKLEITPARTSGEAWSVVEIDRSWPTQVDAVAIDPHSMAITDELRFVEFPLAGKLTRWGIDAHMGSLFGLANQIILIVSAAGAAAMVVLGYLIWWRRRPLRSIASRGVVKVWTRLSLPGKAGTTVLAVLLGVALPVFGLSLLVLLVIDMATGVLTKSEE